MNEMVDIILSPYFSKNTMLVANFCRKCYLKEEEEDVILTAVNRKFLRNCDPKQYQVFTNNFFVTSHMCRTETKVKGQQLKILNVDENSLKHKIIMKIRQKIMRKYFKFNINRNKFERSHSISNKNTKIRKKLTIKNEKCINNVESVEQFCKENISKPETTIKKEHLKVDLKNEEHIKMDIKIEHDEKSVDIKEELKQNILEIEGTSKNSKWIPLISPHNLIEEKYYNDPWALLVVTIFLNRTSCILALPFMEKFFEDFKGPYDVLKVEACNLEPYFTKIGLIRTRANQVWRMSHDFVHKNWKHVGELYGVGKYAEDAYRMFHVGDFNVEPTDRYLKIYKAWYEMKLRNEKLGVLESNSQVYLEDYYVSPEDEDRTEDFEEPN